MSESETDAPQRKDVVVEMRPLKSGRSGHPQKGRRKAGRQVSQFSTTSFQTREEAAVFDRDQDGKVPCSEFRHLITSTPLSEQLPAEVLADIVEAADRDQNGYIDFDEFLDMVMAAEIGDSRPIFRRIIRYAAFTVIPRGKRQKTVRRYMNEYSCLPPPLFMILISLVELGIFIYYAVVAGWTDVAGPVPYESPLIYNPHKRYEAWRFVTYMLIHAGIMHLTFNLLVQLALGIPLEMVHHWWRILIVYLCGVVAGSLGTSLSDPNVYLAGASGGVYALLCAHLASIIMNWSEMDFAIPRLLVFCVLIGTDFAVAVYYRYIKQEDTKTGYAAHIAGGLAGLLIGINVLRNLEKKEWEKVIWWISLITFCCLMLIAIIVNIAVWKPVFDKFDEDGDGKVGCRELRQRIETSPAGDDIPQATLEEIVEKADLDENGFIDFEEFLDMIKGALAQEEHPWLAQVIIRAAFVVVPQNQRKQEVQRYVTEYSCIPPPLFCILISIIEFVIYVYYMAHLGEGVSAGGPVPYDSYLIFNPYRRYEGWRYLTYMLVHAGLMHLLVNLMVQLVLGIPLEMVHKWWRVSIVYMCGVFAGSLGTSVTDPYVFLAGASAGVYALLLAHLASLIINWSEMEFAPLRLLIIIVVIASDLGVAMYYRHQRIDTQTSYAAHISGGIAGLLVGIGVLRNLNKQPWEKIVEYETVMSRLIIKNLPDGVSEEKLRKAFESHGEVTDVQLKYTKSGKFRHFGFLGFKTPEEANAACKYFDKTFLGASRISVEIIKDGAKPRTKKEIRESKSQNLSADLEEDESRSKQKTKIAQDENEEKVEWKEFLTLHTNRGKHWKDDADVQDAQPCTVTAEDTEETDEPREMTDADYLKSKIVPDLVDDHVEKEKKEAPTLKYGQLFTIKVRGLPYSCKKSHLREFFRPVKPKSFRFPRKIKGIAYVGFLTEKEMKQALLKHRSFLEGNRIQVYHYTKKEDMREEDVEEKPQEPKRNFEEAEESVGESGRIFVRNLCYSTTEEDLEKLFSTYGQLSEVHIPIDRLSRKPKGFAYVTFMFPEHAAKAFEVLDGSTFQGRILRLHPSKAKVTWQDLINDSMSFKQKKHLQQKAESNSSHNWNALFLGPNAVADIMAETYKTSKLKVLDPEGKGSVGVRLALGETQIVAQTREFLLNNGVVLDAFSRPPLERSKTVILVKNLPARTKASEIRTLFAKFGELGRVLLPPSGVTAIVEFFQPSEARQAFSKLAYSKFKSGPLYLEWAPSNVFDPSVPPPAPADKEHQERSGSRGEDDEGKVEKEKEEEEGNDEPQGEEPEPETTLFVKNINFATTNADLKKHFSQVGPLHYAQVSKKKDLKTGGFLSMGYGFVQFKKRQHALEAMKTLQGRVLDDHALELKFSNRTHVPNVQKTSHKQTKIGIQKSAKILVRNIPFQATQKEITELFRPFGELKAVRLPKKMAGTGSHRGFGFVEYLTKQDAKRAFKQLCHSTHFYGRRLVLEWAQTDETLDELRLKTALHFQHSGGDESQDPLKKKAKFSMDDFLGEESQE
ncbi:unnamed protein product [Darwinula stevensoni]|uniref:rhomboid protease n=1 Tax=Darwinula stevensoni TaxID=69355 RepID=A0A7R8XBH6_9CRUS|nr:unnamed protein product [Darwinula stevensoni]CAG0884800.1 unnamed protein product [Darwinula stevensoni]